MQQLGTQGAYLHNKEIAHSPLRATINMPGGSGAEDCCAGLPPEDERNAASFRRDAEAAAVATPDAELGRGGVQLSSAAVVFLFSCSNLRRRVDHSNGIEWENSTMFCFASCLTQRGGSF